MTKEDSNKDSERIITYMIQVLPIISQIHYRRHLPSS